MKPSPYTPETLLPACRALFEKALPLVPAEMARKLKPMRTIARHGSRPSVLTWRCWHAKQRAAGLEPQYFNWSLVRDPDHFYADHHEWLLQWSVHLEQVPGDPVAAGKIRAFLEQAVRGLQVPGFTAQEHPREPRVFQEFAFQGPPAGLADRLADSLANLWRVTFPVHEELLRMAVEAGGKSRTAKGADED